MLPGNAGDTLVHCSRIFCLNLYFVSPDLIAGEEKGLANLRLMATGVGPPSPLEGYSFAHRTGACLSKPSLSGSEYFLQIPNLCSPSHCTQASLMRA